MPGPITFLPWDSDFFGRRTGRLLCHGNQGACIALQEAQQDGYGLVYVFSKKPLARAILHRFGGIDVGGQVTFRKPTAHQREESQETAAIRQIQPREAREAVLALALLSGQQSRFRTDHRLPKGSFERLYQQWLVNSLQDQKSSVIISGKEHAPDGLITVAWGQSQAVIGLLAVRQAVQGAGIGSRLLNAVDGEAVRHGARELAVKTQGINQRACSLYLRNGYRETERYELYHFHLS